MHQETNRTAHTTDAEATPSLPADDTRTTALAAALYIAGYGYKLALASPNPAARLDDMCDAVAELWDEITPRLPKKFAGTGLQFAETMRAAVADRLWAFTVVEQARADVGEDFGYVLDILAGNLKNGRDPQAVRDEVPQVVAKIRASRITARIWEARDQADGPWAGILDIVLAAIEDGADPQAVIDQTVGLMNKAIAERRLRDLHAACRADYKNAQTRRTRYSRAGGNQ